jgi:hypothetical protein
MSFFYCQALFNFWGNVMGIPKIGSYVSEVCI